MLTETENPPEPVVVPVPTTRDDVQDVLDTLVRCKGRLVDAQTDAACCRTSADWRKAHSCEEEYENLYGATLDALYGLLARSKAAEQRADAAESKLSRIATLAKAVE